jgi:hypothetical protein
VVGIRQDRITLVVRFQVSAAVKIQVEVFWVVTSCSVVAGSMEL